MVECEQCGNDFPDERAQCPFCGQRRLFRPGAGRQTRPHVHVIRLKDGLPTVDVARDRLERTLSEARRRGDRVAKVIHGYGSSGTGGALRPAIRGLLQRLRRTGAIQTFVPGEEFSRHTETVRRLLNDLPELRGDSDLERGNEGVTLVVL